MSSRVGTRKQERIVEYLLDHPGAGMRDAARDCGCSLSTVHAAVKNSGLVRVTVWQRPEPLPGVCEIPGCGCSGYEHP